MFLDLPESLVKLSKKCRLPLYVVGGYVRNFLIAKIKSDDIDIAAAIPCEEFTECAKSCGFKVIAEYKRTGTVVISDGKNKAEYTRFRTDIYLSGGQHAPERTEFTDDILTDAYRRDFKCNAIYFDIANDKIVDPLGGVIDVENKIVDTVKQPKKVFCSDGLRLLRLARFCAELGFSPSNRAIDGAKIYADNIIDIAPERILEELKRIFFSDKKYPFSAKNGHYLGFKILEETGVLDRIFPEIALGRGMSQRADFHKYDVAEHSLRTLLYSDKNVRFAGFLHDVGKPYCMLKYGKYALHAIEGERIVKQILKRLKADNKTTEEIAYLTRWHMFDLDCSESEKEVKVFISQNEKHLDSLLKLKQADYSAGKDDFSVCPTVLRWTELYKNMKKNGTPFSVKELKITANDLTKIGFKGAEIGKELAKIWRFSVENSVNSAEILLKKAIEDFRSL